MDPSGGALSPDDQRDLLLGRRFSPQLFLVAFHQGTHEFRRLDFEPIAQEDETGQRRAGSGRLQFGNECAIEARCKTELFLIEPAHCPPSLQLGRKGFQ